MKKALLNMLTIFITFIVRVVKSWWRRLFPVHKPYIRPKFNNRKPGRGRSNIQRIKLPNGKTKLIYHGAPKGQDSRPIGKKK